MGQEPSDFTRDLIEAGRKLTERDILRGKFIIGPGGPLQSDGRRAAADHFLAEMLADPDKTEVFRPFFQWIPSLAPLSTPGGTAGPDLWPWPVGTLEPKKIDDPLAGSDEEALVLDFYGRSAALVAGATVSGAARLNESFLYTRAFDGRPISLDDTNEFEISSQNIILPRRADRVLVLGFVRTPAIMGMNPCLSQLRPNIGWLDWAGQVMAVRRIADLFRSLGYLALPSAGGLMMADHHGALAGLGELGRQGLLISPEYGPNLRLFTIITDYPFTLGQPLIFGVADYCETCQRCINECPARAIGEGRRRPGLFQWSVNRRACFDNWLEKKEPCRKCIEVCPYTKEPLIALRR